MRNLISRGTLTVCALACLGVFTPNAGAQVVPFSDLVLNSRGQPAGGASIAVCSNPGFATTAASVTSNIAILTFGSSPITAGFFANMSLTVSGFTGGDTFFNGSFTILTVTSTTLTYALTHANASATSNGSAFQTGNSSTACAPLSSIFSDSAGLVPITQPGFAADGLGNYQFYASPNSYNVQFYGSVLTVRVKPIVLPVSTVNGNTSTQNLTVSGTTTLTGGRPWIDVTGAPYNADPTGVADSTTAIQTAHNACAAFATGPCAVFFPYGTYKFTSLTWSPYVPGISGGRVILTTALASGNAISISDQYGKPTPNPNNDGSVRSKPFTGTFVLKNTNASNTAYAFFIGGATSANFATDLAIDGVSVVGFGSGTAGPTNGGIFKFGYNAFLIHITNFHGLNNGGACFSILAGATNTGEGMRVDSSSFGDDIGFSSPAYLFSWNTSNASDFDFEGVSFDYLLGIWDPAQTAINTNLNFTNKHFEWNQTSGPYIQAAGGVHINAVNMKFFTPLSAGFFSPFVASVTGASTLSIINGRYESGGIIAKLYDNASGTTGNLLNIDPYVNASFQPTAYFTRSGGAGARVTYNSSPVDAPGSYDYSGFAVGVGTLYGGCNASTGPTVHCPQFIWQGGTIIAGVTGNNYNVANAGVAVLEAHDQSGNTGIAGASNVAGATVGATNVSSQGFDSTTKTPIYNANNNGVSAFSGAWNCTNVTPVTLPGTSTTADQNLMACTIPAGTLNRVGRTLRVKVKGIYSTPAASTSQMTLKLKLCTVSGCGSGTVIAPIAIQSTALGTVQITNDNFSLRSEITTQTAGASSAYEASGEFLIDLSTLATAADSEFGDTNTATVGTIDSTAQLFLQTTIAFSSASASNVATQRQLIAETIN